jgi:hypothetical protein
VSDPSLFINAEDIAWAYRVSTNPHPLVADSDRLARVILNLHAINNRLAGLSGTREEQARGGSDG